MRGTDSLCCLVVSSLFESLFCQVINDRAAQQVRLFSGRGQAAGLPSSPIVSWSSGSCNVYHSGEYFSFCFWREMAMTGGMSFDYIGSSSTTKKKGDADFWFFEFVCTQVDRMRSMSCAFFLLFLLSCVPSVPAFFLFIL